MKKQVQLVYIIYIFLSLPPAVYVVKALQKPYKTPKSYTVVVLVFQYHLAGTEIGVVKNLLFDAICTLT
jgi:hypothetical protein